MISVKQLKKLVKKEDTGFLSCRMGTRTQTGQCCGEDRVHWTHGREKARPDEEDWPKEEVPQCGGKGGTDPREGQP